MSKMTLKGLRVIGAFKGPTAPGKQVAIFKASKDRPDEDFKWEKERVVPGTICGMDASLRSAIHQATLQEEMPAVSWAGNVIAPSDEDKNSISKEFAEPIENEKVEKECFQFLFDWIENKELKKQIVAEFGFPEF